MDTDAPKLNGSPEASPEAKLPPFIQVVKTDAGVQIQSNLLNKFLGMALLMEAFAALAERTPSPLVKPNGLFGLKQRMSP